MVFNLIIIEQTLPQAICTSKCDKFVKDLVVISYFLSYKITYYGELFQDENKSVSVKVWNAQNGCVLMKQN